jgi:hypothetical protein
MGKYLDLARLAVLPDIEPTYRVEVDGQTVRGENILFEALQAYEATSQDMAKQERPPGHTVMVALTNSAGKRLRSSYFPCSKKKEGNRM